MNESQLFADVLKLATPQERAAYLDEACAGNPQLRADLEALLHAQASDPDFLEQPAGPLGATVDGPAAPRLPGENLPGLGPTEQPGMVLAGRYKLLEALGEGGMGTVWLAQQQEPVKRLVALKVIKPGMDSKQVLARFEAERQALALMDHPHIARVHDAGTTAAGRPFFVMELVKGVPITSYCDAQRLTPRERLELFIPVCQAIQHAHHKGIIHRDVKPSNVLVALCDDKPVAKVIDFGIAKALGQQLTEHTLVTGLGAVVGTLEYMSPEQAELNQLDIDTRSDVYSLGVLLYELLTGSTPLDRKRLKEAALLEMLRMVREQEPPRPSTRLSDSKDSLPSISAQRHLEPAQLTKLVRGELDWLVMKALEKDRTRRYDTANAFAMDVQRYLADEPVLACPPSTWYRCRKFARRNKAALAMAACVLLALAGIGGALGWAVRDRLAREHEIERQETERRQDIERKEAQQRQEIDREVQGALNEAGVLMGKASWPEALAALGRAAKLLDAAGRQDRPPQLQELQKDLDMAQRLEAIYSQTMVATEDSGGQNGQEQCDRYAQEFQRYGIDVLRLPVAEAAARVRERSIQRELARALDFWSSQEALASRIPANRNRQPADWKRLLEVATAADPDPWRVKLRLALAEVRDGMRRRNQVQELIASAEVAQLPPATLYLLGTALYGTGSCRQAIALLRQAQLRYPDDWPLNNILGRYHNVSYGGPDLDGLHQPDEALRYYTAAQALRPQNPYTLFAIGWILRKKQEYTEAVAVLSRVLELKPDYLRALWERADAQEGLRRWVNALADWSRAIELDPKQTLWWAKRAACYARLQQWDKALADYSKVIELHPIAWNWRQRAGCYASCQQWEKAIADYDNAIKLDPLNAWAVLGERASYYANQKRWDKALADYTKATELNPKNVMAWSQRARYYGSLQQWDKALADCSKAIELNPKNAMAWGQRADCYGRLQQWDKALADYTKVIELDPKCWGTWYNRGRAHGALNQWDNAIADYTKEIELNPKYVVAWGARGAAYLMLKQWDKALADYTKAIELNPQNTFWWQQRGEAHIQLKQGDQALADYTKIIELASKNAGSWLTRGDVYARLKQWDKALADYTTAIELNPKNTWARNQRAGCYLSLQQWDKALADCSKAIELNPKDVNAWYNRGRAYAGLKQWDKALADYSKAIELAPKYVGAWNARAWAYFNLKQWDKAIADFTKAIELDPKYAAAWLNRGIVYGELKQWDKAIADYTKAIELNPKEAYPHNALAWLLATAPNPKVRDPGRAVNWAKKAVELAPKEGSYWNTLGVAHYRAGDYQAALKTLEKSMELRKGGDSFDWFFLAMCHEKLGDKEKARRWYDQATRWMDKNQAANEELRGFRAEAAQVLGVDKKKD